jgi:hypothetical protein
MLARSSCQPIKGLFWALIDVKFEWGESESEAMVGSPLHIGKSFVLMPFIG